MTSAIRVLTSFLAALMVASTGVSTVALAQATSAAALPWNTPEAQTTLFQTKDFDGAFQTSSQTLVALKPKGQGGFDYLPSNRFTQRTGDGYYRLGDLDLRVRLAGETAWQDYSTAFKRGVIKPLPKGPGVIASADISGAFAGQLPLKIVRTWAVDKGQLVLRFTVTNPGKTAVEIGGFGVPMVFDNIITGRHLEEAHDVASFYDPYVGLDAGYLQVNRLNGQGPSLLVLPDTQSAKFELYKPILNERTADKALKIYNDPEPRNMTFEGFYSWMVASKGFADTEWQGVEQWNETTTIAIKPGATQTYAFRFALSPSIRDIETTLTRNDRPVAVGLPGYIVPTDMPASLFLKSRLPVKSIAQYPQDALDISVPVKAKDGWMKYTVTGKTAGRVRVTLTYADGSRQTIHYLVTKPEAEKVADMGRFLTTEQWYENPNDPFGRSPSIMGYDRDKNQIITQDNRVWISGLSDEGGAGSWLATIMKQLDNPTPEEVAKFERFASETLWGDIQVSEGDDKYGVRKSVMFYDPAMPEGTYDPALNWKVWSAWDRKGAADLGRSYNYPHPAAAWWTLYRLGRYHSGLTTKESWQTYLTRAAETTKAMMTKAPYYTQFGQMEGDVFVYILEDLKREGMSELATEVEALMKTRADHWQTLKYPFGSEMPWDSTGQAEVYMWARYFGDQKAADSTREVILAYDPTVPHWGYNGSARRFWDFLYAGKTSRIERQLHHYGSSLNAVPLFDAYRANPQDFHLLRVAYGGLMGSLTNIDDKGFGSAAFHSFPDMMKFDGMNGDYGMSFFGHAVATASYLVDHPLFGWVGMGGIVTEASDTITLAPKDSARSRVFVAPAGLWLTLKAGKIETVSYSPSTGKVTMNLAPATATTPQAFLDVEVTTRDGRAYAPASLQAGPRGGYAIPLGAGTTPVELVPQK